MGIFLPKHKKGLVKTEITSKNLYLIHLLKPMKIKKHYKLTLNPSF